MEEQTFLLEIHSRFLLELKKYGGKELDVTQRNINSTVKFVVIPISSLQKRISTKLILFTFATQQKQRTIKVRQNPADSFVIRGRCILKTLVPGKDRKAEFFFSWYGYFQPVNRRCFTFLFVLFKNIGALASVVGARE